MAKGNGMEPSGEGVGLFNSLRGVFLISALAWIGIGGAYGAGRTVSDKVLKEVKKNDKKHERNKRREAKERRKERERKHKLDRMKAKYGK